MTAGPEQDQRAAQAQAAGEAAAAQHDTAAQAQHAISGSTTAVEAAATPDSHAVQWSEPDGIVSGPTPDNAGQNRSPNVSTPTDNSQSQAAG
jgi:hypothetical protein